MPQSKTTFERLKTGRRISDEDQKFGTVEWIYPSPPMKGAIILWDDGTKSWPNEKQINAMRLVK